MSEHVQQVALIKWFRATYKQYEKLLFSIPNGGLRDPITAIRMKEEGLLAGVPDLMLAIPKNNTHGLFIEMKGKSGRLSQKQTEMINRLNEQHYKCIVVKSYDEAKQAITNYITEAKDNADYAR
jgi:hypothetical protein